MGVVLLPVVLLSASGAYALFTFTAILGRHPQQATIRVLEERIAVQEQAIATFTARVKELEDQLATDTITAASPPPATTRNARGVCGSPAASRPEDNPAIRGAPCA